MGKPPASTAARTAWAKVFKNETQLLEQRSHNSYVPPNGAGPNGRSYLTGICLSGGGIRSATVGLGILQAFAGAGLLRHIDYLSSVSGGGYIASAVAFQYAQGAPDADPDATFPFGPEPANGSDHEPPLLAFLRHHASYLSHSGLADIATGFIVVARSLLLNIFLWVTLAGLALAILMRLFQVAFAGHDCLILARQCNGNAFFDFVLFEAAMLGALLVALMIGFSLSSWHLKTTPYRPEPTGTQGRPQWIFAALAAVCGIVALILAVHALGGVGQWGAIIFSGAPIIWGEWSPGLTIVLLATLAFAAIVIGPRWFGEDHLSRKYARRRFQESFAGRAVLVIVGLLVLGSLPNLRDLLANVPMLAALAGSQGRGPLSALIYLVALGSALFGYYRANLQGKLGLGSSFLIVAGSAFLCFGALLLSYEVAAGLLRVYLRGWPVTFGDVLTVAAPIVALCLGFFVNINDVGLGRYYRDRLMETFLPDQDSVARDEIAPATLADRFRMTDLVARPPSAPGTAPTDRLVGPYPLINVNVMTHAFGDAVARRRGGDSFVLAPKACGSTATGWKPTGEVVDGRLTLATAMATSGAAANPRGGFAGTGPTTSPVVALAMSLLSIRLGYWLRWRPGGGLLKELNPHGNHFIPGASDILGRPGPFVELTDGGHFENLGLYELVRRRCGLIVVCDGGDDRTASYAAFTAAAQRIEEDFGATVAFDFTVRNGAGFERSGPHQVVARSVDDEYPKGAEFARRGYFLGSVKYGDPAKARVPMAATGPSTGLIIYLKSAMIPSLSLNARGYKGANVDFPYESTADQFFSPEQFEAYRDVGVRAAEQMIEDTDLVHLFSEGERPSLCTLRSTYGFAAVGAWEPWEHGHA